MASKINNRKVLIVFMVIVGGDTLDAGLDYLDKQGIQGKLPTASIYITPNAYRRITRERGTDGIVFAYQISEAQEKLDQLPWITSEYDHL